MTNDGTEPVLPTSLVGRIFSVVLHDKWGRDLQQGAHLIVEVSWDHKYIQAEPYGGIYIVSLSERGQLLAFTGPTKVIQEWAEGVAPYFITDTDTSIAEELTLLAGSDEPS